MKQTALLILAALALTGCKTSKQAAPPPLPVVPIETTTNTKIIHTESIDTVYIEIPAQSAERTTPDSFSHLETDYAVSEARINEDGTLSHTLDNKRAKHPVPVNNSTDTIYVEQATEIPIPVQVPVQVERELTAWEKIRLKSWGWITAALVLGAGWSFRKPILNLARRFI